MNPKTRQAEQRLREGVEQIVRKMRPEADEEWVREKTLWYLGEKEDDETPSTPRSAP